jgi:hypothetical protein
MEDNCVYVRDIKEDKFDVVSVKTTTDLSLAKALIVRLKH